MKNWLFLLLSVALSSAHAQHNYESITDEKKADELLTKVRAKQATEADKQALLNIALSIQNKGQNQEENRRDYKKSLTTIDKAIVLFDALEDTLNVANNRKFKGYLLGQFGKFREAKNETKTAIDLYQLKKMNAEVAVAEFDLARMFEFENKVDSAIWYADQSRTFWKLKTVDLRVLIINNMLVSLFLKSNQTEKAKLVQQESVPLIAKPQMQWQAIIDFYFTSMLVFRTINDTGVAGDYQRLYLAKVAELRNTGVNAKSYYEHDRE